MGKFAALWQLFKVGNAVADPALWKRRQITATALGAVILAGVQLAGAFGYRLPIDADAASALAGGVVAFVNVVLTLTTSKTVGLGSPIADVDRLPARDPAAPGAESSGLPIDSGGAD